MIIGLSQLHLESVVSFECFCDSPGPSVKGADDARMILVQISQPTTDQVMEFRAKTKSKC